MEKKSHEKLHPKLANPSPANLRDHTLMRLSEGLSREDDLVLKDFFNPTNQYGDLESSIRRFELDRFRPVINFVKGRTTKPDESIVKLLAVLLDFEPRPFKSSDWVAKQPDEQKPPKTVDSDTDAKEGNGKYREGITEKDLGQQNNDGIIEQDNSSSTHVELEDDNGIIKTDETKESSKTNISLRGLMIRNKRAFRIVGGAILMMVIFIATYYCIPKQCMCWVEDRYIAVDCQNSPISQQTIALNQSKLESFRKITRPDTLTEKDENKVWYSKIDNEVEFFTYPGLHPISPHRPLKAATEHILNKYAGRNAKKE